MTKKVVDVDEGIEKGLEAQGNPDDSAAAAEAAIQARIDAAVAAGLRLRGVDVTTTVEQELQGASDLQ